MKHRPADLLVLLALLLPLLPACKEEPVVEMTWEQLAGFPGAGRASAACFSWGDKAYVCCGRTEFKDGVLNELWQYDSTNDSWTRKSDFPGLPRVKPVGVVLGDKAYVGMGGTIYGDTISEETKNRYNDFWEYDLKNDVWSKRDSFPGNGPIDPTYVAMSGCLFVTMGYTGVERVHETWKYDPRTDEWSRLADCPLSYSVPASFSIGEKMYVTTGFLGTNKQELLAFSPVSNTWSSLAKTPEGRCFSKGTAISGKGYVLLGRFWNGVQNNGRLLSDVIEYDPNTNTWAKRGNFPGGGRQNAMVCTIGSKGYVFMGEDDAERKTDVWCFLP